MTTQKTVLITGCSTGIGRATALAAADAGWNVIATTRQELDVTDPQSIADCVERVMAEHGRLDALVNNAGVGNTVPTIEMADMAAYRANIEVNFFGVVGMVKAAMPHLRASRGRIVTIGSTRGLIGQPFNEAYSAAKFAVEGFLESLAPTAAGMGVRVSIVEPGPVFETSFGANTGVTRESLMAASGPYAEVLEPYLDWVVRMAYPGAQVASDIAEVVLRVLDDPDPGFRVFSSDWAREYAAIKLADPSGKAVQELTRSWLSH